MRVGWTEDNGVEPDAVAHRDHGFPARVGAEVVGDGLGGDFVEVDLLAGTGEAHGGDLAVAGGQERVVGVAAVGCKGCIRFGREVEARGAGALDVEAAGVTEDREDGVRIVLLAVLAGVSVEGGGGDTDRRGLLREEGGNADEGEEESLFKERHADSW